MGKFKGILGFIAIIIFAGVFLAWYLEFNLPFFSAHTYLVIAAVLVIAIIFGQLISKLLFVLAFVAIATGFVFLFFVKEASFAEHYFFFLLGGIALVLALLLNSPRSKNGEK